MKGKHIINILHCHRCPHACAYSGCPADEPCKADAERRPFIYIASKSACPLGRFDAPVTGALRGPGDALLRRISQLGIPVLANSVCRDKGEQMNQWGASECRRRLPDIVGWMEAEAKARGLPWSTSLATFIVRRAIQSFEDVSNEKP